MNAHGWAWLTIALIVPLALFALHRVFRGVRAPRLWLAVLLLIGVVLVLPAPVPGYPGNYAPAFVVFPLEMWFQNPGEPRNAGLILAAGAIAGLAVILLVVSRRRRSGGGSPSDSPPP